MFLPLELGNLKELHVLDVAGNRLRALFFHPIQDGENCQLFNFCNIFKESNNFEISVHLLPLKEILLGYALYIDLIS